MNPDWRSDNNWERRGDPVVDAIMSAARIPESAATDIQEVLGGRFEDFDVATKGEETEFSSDSHYEKLAASDERWQEEWGQFERSLREESRFFSKTRLDLLKRVFDGIGRLSTRDGRSMIVNAGPNTALTSLYRARAFPSGEGLCKAIAWPDQHLGSPPSTLARAGRMNPHGISVFYGARDPKGALAEVRPPVGCEVAVARFDILRPIRLLDLTALQAATTTGSIFDPASRDLFERTAFLKRLSDQISVPVMPNDEASEYLATQAIAEFLATENDPPLDGLIYPSVQYTSKSLNIVLFHKAARVADIELPARTEVESVIYEHNDEQGREHDYIVFEEISQDGEQADPAISIDGRAISLRPTQYVDIEVDGIKIRDSDLRQTTLRVDLESVRVHIVKEVEFETLDYPVQRVRFEKTDPGSSNP